MVFHKSIIQLNHPLKGQIHKQTQMLLLLKNKELAEERLPEEIKENEQTERRDQIEGREQTKTENLDVNKL